MGAKGEQIGIVSITEALRLAQEADLDLVEVAPTARPPVCKLMDYGKFKYESAQKAREARRNQALTVIKVGKGTQEFASDLKKEMAEEPELFHGMLAMDGITAIGGGVPIQVGGHMVGAVAVSGASSAQDQEIAQKAAAVLG